MEIIKDAYLQSLLQNQKHFPASGAAWLNHLRAEATERANSLTLPTPRDEEWRFTDTSPLLKFSFQPVKNAPCVGLSEIKDYLVAESSTTRLVFVDGIYSAELSIKSGVAQGLTISNLADALNSNDELLSKHLAQHANFEKDVFAALNTSFLQETAFVHFPKNCAIKQPVHLLFITTKREQPLIAYPRCLIVMEEGSEGIIVEDYVSLADDVYFNNAVTEISIADNARLQHVRLQREGGKAFHVAQCVVKLGRNAFYNSDAISFGARLSRYNLDIAQAGEGAQCVLDGLALIAGRQHADTHSMIDHMYPHGKSTQLHKCIVGGAARAVFNGKIFVREGAQLINSEQSSRNLLLSDKAKVDTKPQLEIFADDVKCAHGATVGQIDPEELFYLKSRGIEEVAARNMLTYAFAAEIIDKIPIPSLVLKLHHSVMAHTQIWEKL